MEQKELVKYWVDSSDLNYQSMVNMFESGEYIWSLFVGHLVIEKLLKAIYIQMIEMNVPRTHDLLKLAVKSNLNLTDEQKDTLQLLSLFNIETRYEDYKKDFYNKCTKKFTQKQITTIKELREWLRSQIKYGS